MRDLLTVCLDTDTAGILLNPWDHPFLLAKNLICMIFQAEEAAKTLCLFLKGQRKEIEKTFGSHSPVMKLRVRSRIRSAYTSSVTPFPPLYCAEGRFRQ